MWRAKRGRGDLTGPNPTDRGKCRDEKKLLIDGGPLSVVVTGANINEFKLLSSTIESVVVERSDCVQGLCLDNGYGQRRGEPRSPLQRIRPPHQVDRSREARREG